MCGELGMLFFEQSFSYVTFPFLGVRSLPPGVSTPTAKRFGMLAATLASSCFGSPMRAALISA
jgi:hypothetical protein